MKKELKIMKILISDDEIYEIKLPEQIGINDFFVLVNKFNFLLKNFQKFDIGSLNENKLKINEQGESIIISPKLFPNIKKEYKKQDKERWKILRDNRNIFIDILMDNG